MTSTAPPLPPIRTGDELHGQRMDLEKVVYNILTTRYLDWLRAWWATHHIPAPQDTDRAYVLYEMRRHPNIEFIILSTLFFAGPRTSLIVYCSLENLEYIQKILAHNYVAADIRIVDEGDGGREEGRRTYNKTLQSLEFWESLPVEHIILCEMDGYFRAPIPDEFWTYDYVCCPWPWNSDLVGGGGVSLRRRSAMMRIAREHPQPDEYAQDIWVANGVHVLGLNCAPEFVEALYTSDPIALHQWWTFYHPEQLSLEEQLTVVCQYLILEVPLLPPHMLQPRSPAPAAHQPTQPSAPQ